MHRYTLFVFHICFCVFCDKCIAGLRDGNEVILYDILRSQRPSELPTIDIKVINRKQKFWESWRRVILVFTWTKCSDNSAHQTLVFRQVASLHVVQKSCGDSQVGF